MTLSIADFAGRISETKGCLSTHLSPFQIAPKIRIMADLQARPLEVAKHFILNVQKKATGGRRT
jgi:hypothetical protein